MFKLVSKAILIRNVLRRTHCRHLCSSLSQSFDLKKYLPKLKLDSENFQNNGHISRIQQLFDERKDLEKSINELQLELNKDKSQVDKEFHELMASEKAELMGKITALSDKILDNIYYHELEKLDSLPSDINCLFEITAGVGGKEAMLFANELFEMYYKYISFKNWNILEMTMDQEGNYMRHLRATIQGSHVWENLRFEAGVHRVQRVPETEAKGRIHTSTVTVACIPLNEESYVEIRDQDLKMETKRASGAGGQHVNKTESAVRLTHVPSGIVVECQEDRSQVKNREIAVRKLKKILMDQNAKSWVSHFPFSLRIHFKSGLNFKF